MTPVTSRDGSPSAILAGRSLGVGESQIIRSIFALLGPQPPWGPGTRQLSPPEILRLPRRATAEGQRTTFQEQVNRRQGIANGAFGSAATALVIGYSLVCGAEWALRGVGLSGVRDTCAPWFDSVCKLGQ